MKIVAWIIGVLVVFWLIGALSASGYKVISGVVTLAFAIFIFMQIEKKKSK